MSDNKELNKIYNYIELDNKTNVNFTLSNYLNLKKDHGRNHYGHEPALLTYVENKLSDTELVNSTKQKRMIRDTTTDVFTTTLIDKGKALQTFDFIDFMYNYSYSNLLEKINSILSDSDLKTNKQNLSTYMLPLQHYDDIQMYFKGGTLMKYFKDELYKKFPLLIQQQEQNDLNNSFSKNFKVSDTDLSVHIDTKLYVRNSQIKYAISIALSETLKNISTLLEKLMEYTSNNNMMNYTKEQLQDEQLIRNLKDQYINNFHNRVDIRTYFNNHLPNRITVTDRNIYENYLMLKNTIITMKTISNRFDNFRKNVLNISNFFKNINNIFLHDNRIEYVDFRGRNLSVVSCNTIENAKHIELIDYIRYNDFDNYDNNIKPFKKDINNGARYNQEDFLVDYRNLLVETNKYLLGQKFKKIDLLFVNYNEFIDKLSNGIYNIKKDMIDEYNKSNRNQYNINDEGVIDGIRNNTDGFDDINKIYDYDKSPIQEFRFNFNLTKQNIKDNLEYNNDDAKRTDFLLCHSKVISNKNLLVEFRDKNINYVSYNNSLFILNNRNSINIGFALLRIKHNLRLKNIIYNINEQHNLLDINIPSEVLDISISSSFDSTHNSIHNLSSNNDLYTLKIYDSPNEYVVAMNEHNIYNDLNSVLFYQNAFIPWVDKKYNKRIFRMIMFLKILENNYKNEGGENIYREMYDKLKEITRAINIDNNNIVLNRQFDINRFSKNLYNKKIDVDYINSIYNDKFTFDTFIKIKQKYIYIQYIMNFIIINLIYILNIQNNPRNDDSLDFFITMIDNLYNLYDMYNTEFIEQNNNLNKLNIYKLKYIKFINDIKTIFVEFDNNNIIANI